jgi:haloacid dehalogenase-like hydrolase
MRLKGSTVLRKSKSRLLGLLVGAVVVMACATPTPPPAAEPAGAMAMTTPASAATPTAAAAPTPADPLPSWNAGATKSAILSFVSRVTTPGAPDFVPAGERIATFDNDGTLWVEQPMYTQLAFALDRVRELAPAHPEWKKKEPFKSILAGDVKTALAGGDEAILALVEATHAGMSTEDFEREVTLWFSKAKHPTLGRLYADCVYQPMLELLSFMRDSGFKTFIVSGGGIDFMRPVTSRLYGIPPEQVVGTTGKYHFELKDGKPVVMRDPGLTLLDDKAGKPVGIQMHIGRRPLAAFGNSDGDLQMLEWTAGGAGPRLMLLVHHSDGVREFAYDRASHIGTLDKALDEAKEKGWLVVSMKDDWKTIFPKTPAAEHAAPAAPAM